MADAGDIFFQAVHRCGGGVILQFAVNGIIGSAGSGVLHVGRYRFRHRLGDLGFDLVSGLGKQAFCAFLRQVVAAAGVPGSRGVAVLQHGVKQRKLVGVVAAKPRPYAAAAKLDRFQNTGVVGCPGAIPQHPAVCLLNFKLVFGFYAANVMISVVGVIRKAQAQPVGAGNWFVHDGQA